MTLWSRKCGVRSAESYSSSYSSSCSNSSSKLLRRGLSRPPIKTASSTDYPETADLGKKEEWGQKADRTSNNGSRRAQCPVRKACGDLRQATGFGKRATGFGKRATGLGKRATGFGKRATGLGKRATGFGKRATGFGKKATGLGKRATGFGKKATGFGKKATGFWKTQRGFSTSTGLFGGSTRGFQGVGLPRVTIACAFGTPFHPGACSVGGGADSAVNHPRRPALFRPEGARYRSPGQRPWRWNRRPAEGATYLGASGLLFVDLP